MGGSVIFDGVSIFLRDWYISCVHTLLYDEWMSRYVRIYWVGFSAIINLMPPLLSRLFNLRSSLPSTSCVEHTRDLLLSQHLHQLLDRINVLGNDVQGHSGYTRPLQLCLSFWLWFSGALMHWAGQVMENYYWVEETTRLCVSGEWILRTLNRTIHLSATQSLVQAIPTISSMSGFCPTPPTCEWVSFWKPLHTLPCFISLSGSQSRQIDKFEFQTSVELWIAASRMVLKHIIRPSNT